MKTRFFALLTLVTAPLLVAAPGQAQTIESSAGRLSASVLAEGLEHPWALAVLPDGRLQVTEAAGPLLIVSADGARTPVDGVPERVA